MYEHLIERHQQDRRNHHRPRHQLYFRYLSYKDRRRYYRRHRRRRRRRRRYSHRHHQTTINLKMTIWKYCCCHLLLLSIR